MKNVVNANITNNKSVFHQNVNLYYSHSITDQFLKYTVINTVVIDRHLGVTPISAPSRI